MVRQALVEDPTFCMAHLTLARILTDKGLTPQADTEWQAFAKACPKDPDAGYHEAILLMKKGDIEGAAPWLRACVDNAGTQPVGDDCRRSLATLPPELAAAPPPPAEPIREATTIDLPASAQSTPQPATTGQSPAPPASAPTEAPAGVARVRPDKLPEVGP
jgi:hypothetical protein